VSECAAKAGQERYWERWRKVVKAAKKAANKEGEGKGVKAKVKSKPRPKPKPIAHSVMPRMKHAAFLESGAVYMGTLPADTLMGKVTVKAPRMMIGTQAAADAARVTAKATVGKSLGDRARELKEKFRPKGNG
jgi:hypothetical protein